MTVQSYVKIKILCSNSSSLLPYKLRLMNLEIYYAQSVHKSATLLITKYLYSMSNNVNRFNEPLYR